MIINNQMKQLKNLINEIPFISFKPEWLVKVIPPFNGATIRFIVKYNDAEISVYLDSDNNLGFHDGGPYWEVYPLRGDVGRAGINDVDRLISMIDDALNYFYEDDSNV